MLVGEKRLKELTAALVGVKLTLNGDLGNCKKGEKNGYETYRTGAC